MRMRLTTKYGVQQRTNPAITDIVILTTFRFDVTAPTLVARPSAAADGDDRAERHRTERSGAGHARTERSAGNVAGAAAAPPSSAGDLDGTLLGQTRRRRRRESDET